MEGKPYIHKVSVEKIQLSNLTEKFYQEVHAGITDLQNNKELKFDKQRLNVRKCAGCIVNKYCSHKCGKYDKVKYPFERKDIYLNRIEFPEELKSENK
jgi:radical SAM protein with 4Fe4S-binding SPASM domain